MIDAANRAGRVLMIAENVRFDPALQTIRDLLAEGAIGSVSLLQISRDVWFTDEDLLERPWFRSQKTAGGGIMMSGGVHDFEKARMLCGEISEISAVRAPQRLIAMEGDDTSVALVRFESGAMGSIVESFSAKTPATRTGREVHRIRIDGERGSITHENGGSINLFSVRNNARESSVEETIEVAESDTFASEVEHFLRSALSGQEPITSGRSQRRNLELVLAAYRSMEEQGAWQR
jgi:predicted dehydrogenase